MGGQWLPVIMARAHACRRVGRGCVPCACMHVACSIEANRAPQLQGPARPTHGALLAPGPTHTHTSLRLPPFA